MRFLPAPTPPPYGTVSNLDEAIALAGPDAIELTELSASAGQRFHLTLAPDTGTVIWANRQADGSWVTAEVTAEEAITCLPPPVSQEETREYLLLLHSSLSTGKGSIPARIDETIDIYQRRIANLSALKDALTIDEQGL
ncbi:hypothetical protein [Kitasatospora sp. McL0602]|uniref:hypothetical protein n=1 Tax=Kitasatospora sp. McL0602 TaxID=3439530 RepID=UPI003F894AEA